MGLKNNSLRVLLVIVLCGIVAGTASGFIAATITTDKAKYSLGEPMVISGIGFSPNTVIKVSINKPDKTNDTLTGLTDLTGTFRVTYTNASVPGRYKITGTDGINVATTASTEADALATDFKQCSNDNTTLGVCNWINSILQQNNSVIYEGMSTLQRLIFDGIVPTANNTHTLTFHVDAVKGGHHAYDFLTSWEAAIVAANQLHPPKMGYLLHSGRP